MRNLIYDPNIKSVGGFACAISNREGEFRHAVLTDFLMDWPAFAGESYKLRNEDKIDFGASGENLEASVSQFCTGYLSANYVGFYFLKGKIAFVFHPSTTLFADSCTVFREVEPSNLAAVLDAHFGKNLLWRIWVAATAPDRQTKLRTAPVNHHDGISLGIKMHANTFPPKGAVEKAPVLEQWFDRPHDS